MTLGDKVSHSLDFHVHIFSSKLHKMKWNRTEYNMFLITIAQKHKKGQKTCWKNYPK